MRSMMLSAGAIALGLFCCAQAQAGDQDFLIANSTGYTISKIFVSEVNAEKWGGDIMGKDSLEDGHSVDVNFAHDESSCQWDLKVIYDDNEAAEWHNLNLCKIGKVTLHWNKGDGTTTALVE